MLQYWKELSDQGLWFGLKVLILKSRKCMVIVSFLRQINFIGKSPRCLGVWRYWSVKWNSMYVGDWQGPWNKVQTRYIYVLDSCKFVKFFLWKSLVWHILWSLWCVFVSVYWNRNKCAVICLIRGIVKMIIKIPLSVFIAQRFVRPSKQLKQILQIEHNEPF